MNPPSRIAIVGAGWAGLAAAVRAVQRGYRVSVFEAGRTPGGRARAVPLALPPEGTAAALGRPGGGGMWPPRSAASPAALPPEGAAALGRPGGGVVDNGQHILIGAYTSTLELMRAVGVDPAQALRRLPLTLRYPDGSGLSLPRLPRPLDAVAGILAARGWRWADRWALLRAAAGWRRAGFTCDESLSVADLCAALPARVRQDFIEPLCLAALNTPVAEASARVFLCVLRDALLGPSDSLGRSADLLLPQTDLGALLPAPALHWLHAHGAAVHLGQRVSTVRWQAPRWCIGEQPFDQVVLALPAPVAAQVLTASAALAPPPPEAAALLDWSQTAAALRHQAIATVYALAQDVPPWPAPMLALRSDGGTQAPAQFVFDHGALITTGAAKNTRLLAFVASVARLDNATLEQAVLRQAQTQLGLSLRPLRTMTEKRATFACTPGLRRPPMPIARGLLACGDYIDGPYPATLEGAVRSGLQAAEALR
ncbi:MAG: FAD-dependent oxidoreductase [Burkholderiaceae bacterium]|jgi:predicted NAD/FAD-binding protein|nr:FAD-dependent oxidoreductase [Burkholderiaceae bacterium]